MQFKIILKNYRCFPDSNPVEISLKDGLISFVGVNNSGKSSLLRFFYEFRNLFQILHQPRNLIDALTNITSFNYAPSILDMNEVFSNTNNRKLEIQFRFEDAVNNSTNPNFIVVTIPRGSNTCSVKIYLGREHIRTSNKQEINIINRTVLHIGGHLKADLSCFFQVCEDLSETLYIGPFRNAINVGSNENYFDIKVGEAFIRNWRSFKTGPIKQHNEAAYTLTEDIKKIFEFDNLEINPSEDDRTLQIFINGKSYSLPEMGSGITQFVLVLTNAAVKQPSYILIDEPELNLHPSLQLDFLTTLCTYASKGTLFATHNIGLARASSDWIYSVHKVEEGISDVIEFEATQHLSELLGELSFSGYKELGFDMILLVEGTTDVKTIQQFLRKYKMDHKIVLLPLGGSSLINGSREAELGEIKRISNNVFALIDSELDSAEASLNQDREEFVETCNRIGITCQVLERRATENYFTDEAVKKVKGTEYQGLTPYQKLDDISPKWSKPENWRIAREVDKKDLDATDLGIFLNTLKSGLE